MSFSGDEQLETVEDQSLVTIRPKFFVGSSGSVWASDFMMLRSQRHDLFEIPDSNLYTCRYFPIPLRQFFAKINDSAMYFMLTNVKEDLSIIMRSVDNVKYHAAHLDSLQQNLEEAVELVNSALTSLSNSDKDLLSQFLSSIETVKKTCGEINNLLQDKNISAEVEMKRLEGELKMLLPDAMHNLKLPLVRPRIIESTELVLGSVQTILKYAFEMPKSPYSTTPQFVPEFIWLLTTKVKMKLKELIRTLVSTIFSLYGSSPSAV